MMDHTELWLRESVRDLQARYNANGDSGRIDQVVELFAPTSTLELDNAIYRGPSEVRRLFEDTARSLRDATDVPTLRHHTSTVQIDVHTPTDVSSRAYYQVILPHGLDHWGRYLDRFVVIDGQLLFSHRKVTLDGAIPGGWAAGL